METKSPQISYTIIDDPLAKVKIEDMSDDAIYKLCKTEEGVMQYITGIIKSNGGFYDWAYLNDKNVPLVNILVEKGVLRKRKSYCRGFEFQPTS